ncbi:fimbrillin family protein [uncultured Bacteroides sp.]|uniref:fimbrillin family protein n=1 Tax=uncultured Bacteroides sp. TaxID=162156 RepID=UPI0025929F03|nr:fimbrillin family protein [uncultured Bacteroides sp.]
MRKKLYFHHLMLGMAIFMSSCSKNEDSIPANPGDAISFSAATPQSRTDYSDWLQLDWKADDQIGIYSAEANALTEDQDKPKNAEYKITPIYNDGDHKHHADFVPVRDVLKWGSYDDHTFYGAYPAERIEAYPNEVDMKGMFQMKYMTNQVCSVSSSTSPYTTTPDMKNAYMVAKNTLPPTSDEHVLLTFRPVMTTLQINVTAGSTGSDIGTGIIPEPTTITGVSVIMPRALNNGEFLYDVDNSELKEGSVLDGTKESVFVSFNNNGERYIKLNPGEKISFLVFLPPVLMDGSTGDAAKLRIHTTGYQNYVIPMNVDLQQEYKFDIKLPYFDPERIQPNNWMSYMDDKVYVSQLSIPGSYRKLQSIPAGNLLNMGVRALDLRSAGDEMNTITEEIESFLGKNSQEFVIALCNAGSSISSKKVKVIPFNADMTLADARGKILVINEGESGITFNGYTDSNTAISTLTDIGKNINKEWTVTYCAYDNMQKYIVKSSNKAIYDHIVKTQEGNTGIVMIPYACTEKVQSVESSGTYELYSTYGDLFAQSIIDCNFKFIHQFANK